MISREELSRIIMDICASSSHIPNKDTREAIEELEKGKDLTEYKNFRELLKKTGL